MSSKRSQKSNNGSIEKIVVGAAVAIGGIYSFIQYIKGEKVQLNIELERNNARCDQPFVKPEEIVAEEGDLIQILRNMYSHWVVYVGNGYVIHLVNNTNGKPQVLKQLLIKITTIDCVCRVNNLFESAQKLGLISRDVDSILRAAYQNLGETLDYHLIKYNCEHFATECRYGKGFSEQEKASENTPIIRTFGPLLAKSVPDMAVSIAKSANKTAQQ